ncbi:hypothetical protein [Streptomyces sp.]|uniref:hypothetical protein n=1 Tax=Streptomyces sp. TaxID=1931 RepID=UPI002F937B81
MQVTIRIGVGLSGKLVGEVVEWLLTPVAADLTLAERTALLVIAERSNEDTREMWRHRGDEETLFERIQHALGVDKTGLSRVLQRLRARGLEVRIPIKVGKDGREIFAHKGLAMRFRVPEFPASISLPSAPLRADDDPPFSPVDNDSSDTQEAEQRADDDPPSDAKGQTESAQRADERLPLVPLTPSTTYPSKDISLLSSVADVEDATPAAFEEQKFDQREYEAALKRLMEREDFGGPLVARAESDDPGARHEIHVIHAARLAKGIPA